MGEYSKGVSIYIKKCEFVHEIRTKIIIKKSNKNEALANWNWIFKIHIWPPANQSQILKIHI